MNLGPQKISTTYQLVLNQSGGAVTLGDGTTPNWIGSTIASATGTQTISGVKTFQNNTIFNGNVGINDSNPTEKLDIIGNGAISRFAGTTNEWQGIIIQPNQSSSSVNKGAFVDFRNENDIPLASLASYHYSGGNSDFYINTTPSGSRSTDRRVERFRIKSNGDTIIGPASGLTLEVKGGIRTEGGSPGVNGSNNNGYAFSSPGDNDAGMFSSANGQIEFYTNNIERMRISGANIGIGTTIPQKKLHVSGEIVSSALENGNFRMVHGNYGAFFRNDGNYLYLLFTASGDQYGTWNTLRPFYANLVDGSVTVGTNLTVSNSTTTNNLSLGTESNKATISYTQNTARTFTLPSVAADSTFAFINQAQTFTSNQTINANLKVQGNLDFGSSTLGGTAASSFFKTNAGQLGSVAGNTLNLGSVGFLSTNSTSLSFIARRQSAGSDWQTSSIGLTYNVDAVTGVGPGGTPGIQEIWMLPNGNVGLGINAPTEKLHVNGNLKVSGLIATNTITATNGFAIPNVSGKLSADFDMRTKDQVYNILSISLTAGKWLVNANLTYNRTNATATNVLCRISDGVNHYASAEAYRPGTANLPVSLQVTTIITLASATTIILQAQQNGTSATNATTSVAKASTVYGVSPGATQINAVKIG